jgi:hypothetical protein
MGDAGGGVDDIAGDLLGLFVAQGEDAGAVEHVVDLVGLLVNVDALLLAGLQAVDVAE